MINNNKICETHDLTVLRMFLKIKVNIPRPHLHYTEVGILVGPDSTVESKHLNHSKEEPVNVCFIVEFIKKSSKHAGNKGNEFLSYVIMKKQHMHGASQTQLKFMTAFLGM